MRTAIPTCPAREEANERERQEDQQRWERYLSTGDAIAHDAVVEWLDSIGTDAERPCPSPDGGGRL